MIVGPGIQRVKSPSKKSHSRSHSRFTFVLLTLLKKHDIKYDYVENLTPEKPIKDFDFNRTKDLNI